LSFTFKNKSQSLPKILESGKANCVGYSRLFNSICQYIISSNHLEQQFSSSHVIAKIYFLNYDINQLFKSSFFQDHDFVMISDKGNKIEYYFDASLEDYTGVGKVSNKR